MTLPDDFNQVIFEFKRRFPEDAVWFDWHPFGHSRPKLREPMDFFCQAVAEQGWKADRAHEIHARLSRLINGQWLPEVILSLTDTQLTKDVGYSRPKVETVRALAEFWAEHSLAEVKDMSNDEIRAHLKAIKGIGDWTISYFLLYQLHRQILFVEDRLPRLGLQFVLNLKKTPTIAEAKRITTRRWGDLAYFGVMIMFNLGHYQYYHKKYWNFSSARVN